MKTVTLTRRELYDLVWAEPVRKVAARFGLSDVGLRKKCAAIDVPTPPLGYWAKLAHGKKVTRTPLPAARKVTPSEVRLRQLPSLQAELDAEEPVPDVRVPGSLAGCDEVTLAVQAWLATGEAGKDGLLGQQHGGAAFWLSPALVGRSLLVLEAVIRTLKSRGHEVKYERYESRWGSECVVVVAHGGRLQLRMTEGLARVAHEWTPREKKYHSDWGKEPSRKWDQRPNGKLKVTVLGNGRRSEGKTWGDTSARLLEARLGAIVLEIERFAVAARLAVEEQARVEAEERARFLASVREKRMPAYRKWLRQDLLDMTERRQKANALREFIAGYEQYAGTSADQIYIAQARELARRIDPLTSGENVAKPVEPSDEFLAQVVEATGGR